MPILPHLVRDSLFGNLLRSCRKVAQVDLNELNCKKLAEGFINVPTVFLFSKRDKLVRPADSMKMFGKLTTDFKVFVDSGVRHDQRRPEAKIRRVFLELEELRLKKQNRRKSSRKRGKSQRALSKRSVTDTSTRRLRDCRKEPRAKHFSRAHKSQKPQTGSMRAPEAPVKAVLLWESEVLAETPPQNYDSVSHFLKESGFCLGKSRQANGQIQSLKSSKVYLDFDAKVPLEPKGQSLVASELSTGKSLKKGLSKHSELLFESGPKTSIFCRPPAEAELRGKKYITLPTTSAQAIPLEPARRRARESKRPQSKFTQSSSNLALTVEDFRQIQFQRKKKFAQKSAIRKQSQPQTQSHSRPYGRANTPTLARSPKIQAHFQRTHGGAFRSSKGVSGGSGAPKSPKRIHETPEKVPRQPTYQEMQRTYVSQPKIYVRGGRRDKSGLISERHTRVFASPAARENVSVAPNAKAAEPKQRLLSWDVHTTVETAPRLPEQAFIKHSFPLHIKQNYILGPVVTTSAFVKNSPQSVHNHPTISRKQLQVQKYQIGQVHRRLKLPSQVQIHAFSKRQTQAQAAPGLQSRNRNIQIPEATQQPALNRLESLMGGEHQASKIQKSHSISRFLKGDAATRKHCNPGNLPDQSPAPPKRAAQTKSKKLRFVSSHAKAREAQTRTEDALSRSWKTKSRQGNPSPLRRRPGCANAVFRRKLANNEINRISENIQRFSKQNWMQKKKGFSPKSRRLKPNYSLKTYKFS